MKITTIFDGGCYYREEEDEKGNKVVSPIFITDRETIKECIVALLLLKSKVGDKFAYKVNDGIFAGPENTVILSDLIDQLRSEYEEQAEAYDCDDAKVSEILRSVLSKKHKEEGVNA